MEIFTVGTNRQAGVLVGLWLLGASAVGCGQAAPSAAYAAASPVATATRVPATATTAPAATSTPVPTTATSLPPVSTSAPATAPDARTGGPACQHTIGLTVAKVDGTVNYADVEPGDTVCIEAGSRTELFLANFLGHPDRPITFVNAGGTVHITNEDSDGGIVIKNSAHVRITGSGAERHCGAPFAEGDQRCGIRIDAGVARGVYATGRTDGIEIDHVEVFDGPEAAIVAKTDSAASTFVQEGVNVHHTWIHDMLAGSRKGAEAMYIGMSNYPEGHSTRGVEIAYNRTARIGWESYQVSGATEDCRIHDNVSRDDSKAVRRGQNASIVAKFGSVCDIENNLILDTNSMGILDYGHGGNRIANNVIIRVGRGERAGTRDGAGIRFMEGDQPNRAVAILNNTIISPNGPGIAGDGLGEASWIANNLIVHPFGGKYVDVLGARVETNLTLARADDAGFANPSEDDYSLAAGSPAIDRGTDLRPAGVTVDFRGTVRPLGRGFDIGAFEYGP